MRRVLLMLSLAWAPAALAQPYVTGAPVPFAPEGFGHAVVSPTGERVALTSPSYAGVWVMDAAAGSVPRRLSDAVGAGFGMAWSPDGQRLAARVARLDASGARASQVVVLDAATGEETALTAPSAGFVSAPRFSPDGTSVLSATADGVQVSALADVPVSPSPAAGPVLGLDGAVLRAPGGAAFALPTPDARVLRLVPSPDGRRVAVQVYGGDLYVANADGSGAVSLGRGEAPTWRPDGQYVAFMVTRDDGHELLGSDLVVARADGQQRRALTRTEGVMEMYPAWLANDALLYDDVATGRVMRLPLSEN